MNSESFENTFKAITDLAAQQGPNRNIFEPKFQARTQMEALLSAVSGAFAEKPTLEAQAQLARINGFLGNNYIEVEEEKEGFQFLYVAHRIVLSCVRGVLLSPESVRSKEGTALKDILMTSDPDISDATGYAFVTEYMAILNTLGLHMSNSDSPQRLTDAVKILLLAERTYERWNYYFTEVKKGPVISDLTITVPEVDKDKSTMARAGELDTTNLTPESVVSHKLRLKMDTLYTSTLFFLAQAYATTDVTQASKYAHLTMVHQLETKAEFDKKTWAENALHVSGFYSANHDYGRALHCLEAGRYMMPTKPDDEETTGRVVWAFGRYHLNRLRYYGSTPVEELSVDRVGAWFVPFPLPIPSVAPQPAIHTFEEAREEFKLGKVQLEKALEYNKFDGQCADHIIIRQDLSQLYKALIVFEQNLDRQVAMHDRRLKLLEEIPDQLNPQAYLTTIRQLHFDIGDIHNDIFDLRMKQRRSQERVFGKPLSEKRINELNDITIQWFDKFLSTFQELHSVRQPEEVRVAIFRALMRRCSLLTKKFFSAPQEEFEAIGRAIEEYAKVIAFAERNPMGNEVADEVLLAKQMHELLPGKQKSIAQAYNRN